MSASTDLLHGTDELWVFRLFVFFFFFNWKSLFHVSLCRTGDYKYKRGTTGVLTKAVTPIDLELLEESVQTMDTS